MHLIKHMLVFNHFNIPTNSTWIFKKKCVLTLNSDKVNIELKIMWKDNEIMLKYSQQ